MTYSEDYPPNRRNVPPLSDSYTYEEPNYDLEDDRGTNTGCYVKAVALVIIVAILYFACR